MSTAIVTLASAKAWLTIPVLDTTQDATLEVIVAAVNDAIEAYCDASFSPVVVESEMHDARRQDVIVPDGWPVISVERLAVGTNALGIGGTELTTEEYLVRDGEIVLVGRSLPQGRGLVAIDYTHGYVAVPSKVTMAGMLSVEAYYRMKTNKQVGIVSKAKEGESINYQKGWSERAGLPNEAIGLLAEYRVLGYPSGTSMATRNR